MPPPQFYIFCDYLSFEEDLALHLNKLESPSPKDDLYKVWLNLAQLFWRRWFLNDPTPILHFLLLSPLWRGPGPSFEQTWIPFTQRWFVLRFIQFGPVVLEKKKRPHLNFTFLSLSPLSKGPGPLFEQTWIPITYGWLVLSLIEFGPVVLEKKVF